MAQIPLSLIGAVASVLAAHYYSHSKLTTLFMENGAPGDEPGGNCETKCTAWLKRCNDDPQVDALAVLGRIIQPFMDQPVPAPTAAIPWEDSNLAESPIQAGKQRILEALKRNHLTYVENGFITQIGASLATRSLAQHIQTGDLKSINDEFQRALQQIDSDPHAAITAASAIIEAACKTYIESFHLDMPSKQTVVPLWRCVQNDLGLNIDPTLQDDQKKILQGLSSIVDGIGAYRTHIGSAHGRGIAPPLIDVAEARLAVNASHTLVMFMMERWPGTPLRASESLN